MFKDKIKDAVDKFYKDYRKAAEELQYNQMTKVEYQNAYMRDPVDALTDVLNDVIDKEIEERTNKKYLLVEDGSIDIDNQDLIDDLCNSNIKVILYRQGANKPEFLSRL